MSAAGPADHSWAVQSPDQHVDGNQGVSIAAILSSVHCHGNNRNLLFFKHSNQTTDRSSVRPDKLFNHLCTQGIILCTHWYPLRFLKCSFLKQPMPVMHRDSRPVRVGCFHHSFPVKLTSTYKAGSFWDLPGTQELQMDSAPLQSDGTRVHCVQISTRPLYSLLLLSSTWSKAGPLYSWLESSLLDISNCKTDKEVFLSGSVVQSGLLLHSTGTGAGIFVDRSFGLLFSFHFPSF